MPKGIKLKKIQNTPLGNFLANMRFIGKEYGFNILCMMLTPKGCSMQTTRRRLLGLREKGYFDISKRNNKTFFKLTPKGKNLAEALKFRMGKIKWDKRWRVLIFDIPEKEKYKREYLRRELVGYGFRQLQESVWITPYPLPERFTDFVADLRVRPYLYSLTVDAINREDELKKYFKLR